MTEPDRVLIQHLLISFRETPVQAPRTRAEAESLAHALFTRAQAGEDFSALAREHSDDPCEENDPAPGRYLILNHGITSDGSFERLIDGSNERAENHHAELEKQLDDGKITVEQAEQDLEAFIEALRNEIEAARATHGFPRGTLVSAFGDVGFGLQPGEVAMAEHDEERSPFGWHVIKRLA